MSAEVVAREPSAAGPAPRRPWPLRRRSRTGSPARCHLRSRGPHIRGCQRDRAHGVRVLVAFGVFLRRTAQEVADRTVAEVEPVGSGKVEEAGLADDAGEVHGAVVVLPEQLAVRVRCAELAEPARPAAQTARWPPAEWPRATTLSRPSPCSSATSRSLSIPASTSSKVCGQPPPLPARRYSRFQAAMPCAARSFASGSPSSAPYCERQYPPWMTTTTPGCPASPAGTAHPTGWGHRRTGTCAASLRPPSGPVNRQRRVPPVSLLLRPANQSPTPHISHVPSLPWRRGTA